MKLDLSEIELVQLAPEPEGNREAVVGYATQLADILNTDHALPPEYIRPSEESAETAESVLKTARDWCRERNALSFVVVLGDGTVAGAVSLSHIDNNTSTARAGYFITGRLQGQGLGSEALKHLLDVARDQGMLSVSASVALENKASRRIWEKSGTEVSFTDESVKALISPRPNVL